MPQTRRAQAVSLVKKTKMDRAFPFEVGDFLWVRDGMYWACYVSQVDIKLIITVKYPYVYDGAGNNKDKIEYTDLQISRGSIRSRIKHLDSFVPSIAKSLEDVRKRRVHWFASTRGLILYCKENCESLYSKLPEELKKFAYERNNGDVGVNDGQNTVAPHIYPVNQ